MTAVTKLRTTTTARKKGMARLHVSPNDPRRNVDWVLALATMVLCAYGMVAIYSARYEVQVNAGFDPYYYVKRQALSLAVGFAAMVAIMLFDHRRIRDHAWILFVGANGLLALVLVISRATNGASAWLRFGGFSLQPSELAKPVLVVVLASYLAGTRSASDDLPFDRFVGALGVLALPAGLTLLQPDLGSASVLIAITMAMLLVAGSNSRHIAIITVLSAVTVGALLATPGTLDNYQRQRIETFINPQGVSKDAALQVDKSKLAIAYGGVSGQGFLKGPITNGGFVPENHTDFIFSAIGEQFGFAGTAALLFLFALIVFRLWRIAAMSRDLMGTLLCAGAIATIVWHLFENLGMSMGIMPVTGIPLPFVSYGGSSLIAFLALIGLGQSVHMRRFG